MRSNQNAPDIKLSGINLQQPTAELFDSEAERVAQRLADPLTRHANKPTQLRAFYDELVMWDQRMRRANTDELSSQLPLIRMLNAKVAYACGRDLVDANYLALMKHLIGQIKDKETLRNAKLFLEAFMGFFKIYGNDK
ncbi:MAG: type III-A CRISPR-associated protein Csm2 [Oceanospirillaceae bacterium]|nr:type III-A CRISPR-associated protein Csm2 [Oceanospirillaceae bacterium]